MNSRQAAGLPLRHECINDGAGGPPTGSLPAPLLHAAADIVDSRLQALRFRGSGGLLLPRKLRFATTVG